MLKIKNLLKSLFESKNLRSVIWLLGFLWISKLICQYWQILVEYDYILDFLIYRLCFILCILVLLQSLLNLPLVKDLQKEMSIYNEGPASKSGFITSLRKYHFSLILSAFLSYSLGVTYFVEDYMISYLLGLISFLSIILYLVQFVVYTKEYVRKSFKSGNTPSDGNKRDGQRRTVMNAANAKR